MWQISIDTGGTFTDCYGRDPDNNIFRFKVLSAGVLRGTVSSHSEDNIVSFEHNWPIDQDIFKGYNFQKLNSDKLIEIEKIDFNNQLIYLSNSIKTSKGELFQITAHEEAPILATRIITKTSLQDQLPKIKLHIGTTKGTNAILEKKGAKTGVLLTKGFKDLMLIDNQQRPNLFQLDIPNPTLYYDAALEIDERIDANGNIVRPLLIDEAEIRNFIVSNELESIAIVLANSYINAAHELALYGKLKSIINSISVSTKLSPTINYLKRAKTTVVNAYLQPVINQYVDRIHQVVNASGTFIMKSSGGLVRSTAFHAKDSLLSGPAGGVVGIAAISKMVKKPRLIGFDMGGTSTDVSRYDGVYDYVDELSIGGTLLKTPAINIHTVAAGGGSIITYHNGQLQVGPESAGSFPGPACYGAGGPLTVTDINLLLDKIHPDTFRIPVSKSASMHAFQELKSKIDATEEDDRSILEGIEQIANEKMAQAIRQISISKGFDPSDYTLCGFGGAGGLHVCAIADILDIQSIVIPYDAGILSAFGLYYAPLEKMSKRQILKPLADIKENLNSIIKELEDQVIEDFRNDGINCTRTDIANQFIHLRLQGQSDTIEIDHKLSIHLEQDFEKAYRNRFGYYPDKVIIEVERIEVIGQINQEFNFRQKANKLINSINADLKFEYEIIDHTHIQINEQIKGPVILRHNNSTAFIPNNWSGFADDFGNVHLIKNKYSSNSETAINESIQQALFKNRFTAIADEMGHQLQRTSYSVNIRERLDFSCAVLNAEARLLVNAPHIPVHLGSLGICARLVLQSAKLKPGDVLLTNHPKYGGSHLPDLTMLTGAYSENGDLIGYLINRAHHAEIGGSKPGSMPPSAQTLEEEGVAFTPFYLVKEGVLQETRLNEFLNNARYPSRMPDHNVADIKAGIAALESGRKALVNLADKYGLEVVHHYMFQTSKIASETIFNNLIIQDILNNGTEYRAIETLDDGHEIHICIFGENNKVIFDFSGSSAVHPNNLNANLSIIYSAVIYVLRLLIKDDIPLNEGILDNVEIRVPEGTFLRPAFEDDARNCPAVVGGNTEVSQRVVDTLIKALGLAACSQGTMNNFLFGNDGFGYYETICGGVGAVDGKDGRSAVHQHMTNTRMTDIEELEHNYPVRLNECSIRDSSGGSGRYKGGDGIIRDITFLEDVEMTIIGQHRQVPPYGLLGGSPGKKGEQYIISPSGDRMQIEGIGAHEMSKGSRVILKTPGGGGFLKEQL